jgi:hypothetical protein
VVSVGQSGLLLFQKQFSVCYSSLFLVCSVCVFCCCGVGQNSEAFTFFGCSWLVSFLFAVFISYRKSKCFCFLVAVWGGQVGFLLFQKPVFKIIPGFVVSAFLLQQFSVESVTLFVSKVSFATANSNFFFMQTGFSFLNSIRFSFHCCLCFICYSFMFTACTLHGVLCKAGRTLSCPGSSNAIGLLFRAGRALLGFWLLPFTFLSLISSGSGAGR